MAELSYDEVSRLIKADFETGKLYWLPRPAEMFPTSRAAKWWNTMYAGKPALIMVDDKGYLVGSIFDRPHKAHRVMWLLRTGDWPAGQIDHENGVKSDNRFCNLRVVTNSENAKNKAISDRNKSGALGVFWCPRNRKWRAEIRINRKSKYLGLFDEREKAIAARKAAELANGFHANHGRASAAEKRQPDAVEREACR